MIAAPVTVFVILRNDGRYLQFPGWTPHLARATVFGLVHEAMGTLRGAHARLPAPIAAECQIVTAKVDAEGRTVPLDG